MFKRTLISTLLLLFSTQLLYAQKDDGKSFGISFKGFVKTDLMFDSRQTASVREGHFLLYPANEVLDHNGEDINAEPNLNMLAIQTRLTGVVTAPDALGAKTSGVIEGAFFGHTNSDVNGFRLRHAFVKLAWENSTLLVGQYWHPMFITEVFPGTISFNTGVPFQPFARNPQVRYIHSVSDFDVTLTAASQRDFASIGPADPKTPTSKYLRDAVTPIMNLNLKYVTPGLVAGVGANYMSLRPLLETRNAADERFKTDEKISSLSTMAFLKVTSGDFQFKAEGVMGENTNDVLMLGGYAAKAVDATTGAVEYTNIKTFSAWTDIIYGKAFQVALFAGYSENQGSDDEIVGNYYSRGSNIANVMRVSPRVQYTTGKFRFAAEIEHTIAEYGTPNEKGVVEEMTDAAGAVTSELNAISNTRVLFSAYLFF
jgi:hypothetical protein